MTPDDRSRAGALIRSMIPHALQECEGDGKCMIEQDGVEFMYSLGFCGDYAAALAFCAAVEALDKLHKAAVAQHPDFPHDLHGRTAVTAYEEALALCDTVLQRALELGDA